MMTYYFMRGMKNDTFLHIIEKKVIFFVFLTEETQKDNSKNISNNMVVL